MYAVTARLSRSAWAAQALSFMPGRLTFRCNMWQELFCMKAAFLPDRGVVKVTGEDAGDSSTGSSPPIGPVAARATAGSARC